MSIALFILGSIVFAVLAVLLLYEVHCALDRLCVKYARRFCKKHGLEVRRSRAGMAFDSSGVKTEFTIVELDCRDEQNQRKLVRLLVWAFGVRKVLRDEVYPDSFDEQWPQTNA